MGGGKGKNKKRKNNEGDPVSPPPPEGYRSGGVLPTPSPTPNVAMTMAALQQVTIAEEIDDVGTWKKRYETVAELNQLLTVAAKDYASLTVQLREKIDRIT